MQPVSGPAIHSESYPDTMSAQRNEDTSPRRKRSVYLFGGFRGLTRQFVVLGVLLALAVFFRDQSHSGGLPEWVAPFASVAFVALIPAGAVAYGFFEHRLKAKAEASAGGSGS